MAMARYKDLCIDTTGGPDLGRFWGDGAAAGRRRHPLACSADPGGNEFCVFVD